MWIYISGKFEIKGYYEALNKLLNPSKVYF